MRDFRRHVRRAACFLLVICPFSDQAASQEEEMPPAPRAEATEAEIEQWISQLDSDRFLDREIATQQLLKAGTACVPKLLEAIPADNKEVSTRVIQILQQLGQAADLQTAAAGWVALEQIAEGRRFSAAARASAALQRVAEVWASRALDHLKRKGAELVKPEPQFGLVEASLSITIGDQWKGRPEDLEMLRWLSDIHELLLEGPQVKDPWLKYLAAASGVRQITIKRAEISDAGAEQLASLRDLSALSLMHVPLTDASVEPLSRMTRVAKVRIFGTKISDDGARRLQQRLAGTVVDHRRGGFLGVGCQNLLQGCVISTVREGTAAEQAGLAAGDLILTYDRQKVENFEQLTELIAADAPGDSVTLEIIRGPQRLAKQVTLGAW